jgi:hypothetical protein
MSYLPKDRLPSTHTVLESLEPRLLLTTLHGGEFFVYQNSQGLSVRVDLIGSATDSAELMASEGGQIIDLPGLLNGVTEVLWADGQSVVTVDDNGDMEWAEFSDDDGIRGAMTEIYSIYIASSTSNTVLAVATLVADQPNGDNWTTDIDQWGATDLPVLGNYYGFAGTATTTPAANSGGVIIGSLMTGLDPDEGPQFQSVSSSYPTVENPLGVFPGGELYAGIQVSGEPFSLSGISLGGNVNAVATDSYGIVWAIDDSALQAVTLSDNTFGGLGSSLSSLAARNGVFYSADNAKQVIRAGGPSMGDSVVSLTVDDAGVFWAVDNTTHQLVSSTAAGAVTQVGPLLDATTPEFRYDNVTSLAINPTSDVMFGIAGTITDLDTTNGTVPTGTGPCLITINTTTGAATLIARITGAVVQEIAFNASGTCYGIDTATNKLVTIDTDPASANKGKATAGATIMYNARPLSNLVGMTFVGTALYAVTANTIFRINTATGAATSWGSGTPGMGSAAYSALYPGYLFTATDSGGYHLVRVSLGSTFVRASSAGTPTVVGVLRNATTPTTVYTNVTAMAFSGANLIALATDYDLLTTTSSGSRQFIQINAATGAATQLNTLSGDATDLTTIAYNGASVYGSDGSSLYSISAGVSSEIGSMGIAGTVQGMDFAAVGGNQVLYAVTNSEIYAIDPSDATSYLLGETGKTDMPALAYDSSVPLTLWTLTNENGYRVARIELTAMLVRYNPSLATVTRTPLVDVTEPAYTFTGVRGMDFTMLDELWAVGSEINIDPVNVADPASAGPFLMTVDTSGTVAVGADVSALGELNSIVWNGSDLLGVAAVSNHLLQINSATGALVADIGTIGGGAITTDVMGLAIVGGQLYAMSDDSFYVVSLIDASATLIQTYGITGFSSLSSDPTDPFAVWTTVTVNGQSQVVSLPVSGSTGNDMHAVVIGGTLAGTLINPAGSIDRIVMGYIWGNINVAENVDVLYIHQGGGAQSVYEVSPADSTITVGGTLNAMYVPNGTLMSAVNVLSDPAAPLPAPVVQELAVAVDDDAYDYYWTRAYLLDVTNDTAATAQFINASADSVTLASSVPQGDAEDWYALPMLAGQTVVISETIAGMGLLGAVVEWYDSAGRLMDTLGYETIEDWGITSRGTTRKPMTFTAPAADIYYMRVRQTSPFGGSYNLTITGATFGNLGAMVASAYTGGAFSDTTLSLYGDDITVRGGGSLGALVVGTATDMGVHTIGGGDIVAARIGAFAGNMFSRIYSDGNIGSVTTYTGAMDAYVSAGYGGGLYNSDAFIQNIRSAGSLEGNVESSGNIGVIDVAGSLLGGLISANADGQGQGARVDLINVGGDWGSLDNIPVLRHGPGGDIGFVNIVGSIYAIDGMFIGPLNPTTYTGQYINDDGGGRLKITSVGQTQVDPLTGQPVVDPLTGLPLVTYPTITYSLIPVDDLIGGVGGVIANLTISGGSASLNASGVVDISELVFNGNAALGGSDLTLTGSGIIGVYHLQATNLHDLVNWTSGDLVSGSIDGANHIIITGDIGAASGTTGAWLPGRDQATGGGSATSPAYGWFNGTFNGLDVTGSLVELTVGGDLHDLRVGGTVGRIVVNSDKVAANGAWEGVSGIVFATGQIGYISVGDGLADDGGALIAKAAIMSAGSIGTVAISGPRRVINNRVYGELQGSILAMTDYTVPVVDYFGNITGTQLVPAIENVIGTNGATLTAIVAGAELDWFQVMKTSNFVSTGGVGTVSFSGPGAEINGAEIDGLYVKKILTSADSNGISNLYSYAAVPLAGQPGIGLVEAGGPGLYNGHFSVNGGSIGTVRGKGALADIRNSTFVATDGMVEVSGRDLYYNGFHMPGTIGKIAAARDMRFNSDTTAGGALVGAINTITVGGAFDSNTLTIAGRLGDMSVGGSFTNSQVVMQGPTVADLNRLTINGNFTGEITSAGRIGRIYIGGTAAGSISTLGSGQGSGWTSDLEDLEVVGPFTGSLSVGGSLLKFYSHVTLGTAATQTFNIGRNLGTLTVGSSAVRADLLASLDVGGSIDTMRIFGSFFGNVATNGDLGTLALDGSLAGGSLTVLGTIKTLSFSSSSNLVSSLTVGGTLAAITLNGGSIIGDITSRFGSLVRITVTNGSILGDLTANNMGDISVVNGSIAGNITVLNGGINLLSVKNGNLIAPSVSVTSGGINRIKVENGGVGAGVIDVTGSVNEVSVSGGNFSDNLFTQRSIGSLTVAGGSLYGRVSADADILNMNVAGEIATRVRAGGTIDKLTAGQIRDSIVSSGGSMNAVKVNGSVIISTLVAGYDIGRDLVVSGVGAPGSDDILRNANIKSLVITGALNDSNVVAGLGPGADLDFGTVGGNAADYSAGTSSILSMRVGSFAVGSQSTIQADNYIDSRLVASAQAAGVVVDYGCKLWATDSANPAAVNFGPQGGRTTVTVGSLTLKLTGSGRGNFDPATGSLVLHGITTKSKLTLTGTSATTINIASDDDSFLSSFQSDPGVALGNVSIDGSVGTLKVYNVVAGSTWSIASGGTTMIFYPGGALMNATLGDVGTLQFFGSLLGGSTVNIRSIGKSLSVGGSLAGNLNVLAATVPQATVGGDLTGVFSSFGSVSRLQVGGATSGIASVSNGDLGNFSSGGAFSGSLAVGRGSLGSATIASGNMGGNVNTAIRTAGSIGSISIPAGSLTGLVSASGGMGTLSMAGMLAGRVWAGYSINTISAFNMIGAVVTATNDIGVIKLPGNMEDSFVLAGFDSGDAGRSATTGETGNLGVDRWSTPLYPGQLDSASGGSITKITVGGDMWRSSVGAGIAPGADGYLGTPDDVVAGTGYIGGVFVTHGIYGSASSAQSFGIYAANNYPPVTAFGRPWAGSSNASLGSMATSGGNLRVAELTTTGNTMKVTLNRGVNSSTISTSSVQLLASVDDDFATTADNTTITLDPRASIIYSNAEHTITIRLAGVTWDTLTNTVGKNLRLTLDDSLMDTRGNSLDGEFVGAYPSGDGAPGGDFIYEIHWGDYANYLTSAIYESPLALVAGQMKVLSSKFDTTYDTDILHFSGNANEYFAARFLGNAIASMGLFYRDTQGTAGYSGDDTFELVAAWEGKAMANDELFGAWELPATGEYYLAFTWNGTGSAFYTMNLTYAGTDASLVSALGGSLPAGEGIAYVSNTLGAANNSLGFNSPKQLVYVNFGGGTATQFTDTISSVSVNGFSMDGIDSTLSGREHDIVFGAAGITGIMDNLVAIFNSGQPTNVLGTLRAQQLDLNNASHRAFYDATADGLFLTTTDPASVGISDYATVFVGQADDWAFGDVRSVASAVDIANMSKSGQAIIFTQKFVGLSAAASDVSRAAAYSMGFANSIAQEIGHLLGLVDTYQTLTLDDPDEVAPLADVNSGRQSVMTAPAFLSFPTTWTAGRWYLGTASVYGGYGSFSIGSQDQVTSLLRWLK